MSLGSRFTLVVTCLTLVLPGPCRAQQNDCFTSSSIVGAVLGTFFATAVALALLVFFIWWIYYRRTPNGADRQTKGPRIVESGSGFDNPCFEANPNSDVVDGGKADDYGQKDARSTSWTPLRFFGANKNEKKRSMDDSFISEPERVSVQLRGRDFTGLGLNVTGNMRDGIFIKDISNRGPAFESGKIAPGDRILNVTISFRNVVFEDAMTILSYASPYDVTLELEKGLRNNGSTLKKRKASSTVSLASSSANVTLLAGTGSAQPEGPPNERLVHPLYRSQSIDDLSKVGRADNTIRAEVRIPNLTGHLSGGLAKSKLLGKANLEIDAPNVPDVKIKGGIPKPGSVNISLDPGDINVAPPDASLTVDPSRSSKMSKFGIKVLPDFKFKGSAKSPDLGMTPLPTGLDVREAELSIPKVEIHTPKASDLAVDIDMPDGSRIKSPKGSISMAIDMPDQEFSAAVPAMNVPSDVKLNIEAPSLNVSAPSGVAEVNVKGPAISQPKMDINLPTSANLGLDFTSPRLPDVEVDQEIPNDVSLDLNKAAKSGFHIKFPKFGGNKSAKAEIPETGVEITAPEIDVSLPEASLEMDPKLKKDGSKAGFEFKMPKLSLKKKPELGVEVKTPFSVQAQIPEIDVDVKMPGASVDIQPPSVSVSAPEVELPSASIDVKKPKIGFSMPKFNMGNDNVELKDSLDVNVGIPSAHIDVSRQSDDSDSDDDSEGGKKKLKFGKVPKISLNKPHIEVEASVPDASAKIELPDAQVDVGDFDKMDVKTKNKFGFKIPKFGAGANISGGELDLDASRELEVKLPSAEVKIETSDSSDDDEDENGEKKKKRFNIKMPKFGLPKAEVDVNAPNIAMPSITADVPNIKPIGGSLEIGVPNLSGDVLGMQSDSEDSDSKDEGKKKRKSLKINAPELQLGGGINSPSLALSPIAIGDVNTSGGADVSFDVKAPSLSFSTPVSSSEFKVKGPRIDQPNIDVSLPTGANLDVSLKAPSLPDVPVVPDISNPEVSVDLNKASKSGFHIKFPKFGGSKTVKADVPDAGVKIVAPEIDVSLPEASLEIDPKLKKDGSKAGFEFKMPKLSLKKKPELAMEVKAPSSVQAQIPEIDVDVKMPGASVDIQPPSLSVSAPEVELPSASVDVKKPKIGFSMPKFNMGKGHVELKDSSNIVVDVPNVKADLPHLSALSDSEESEGGKKKLKFGKMPKMSMNKPHIEVEASIPDASVAVPDIDVGDLDVKTKNKFGFKIPKFGAGANISGGDLDLDASRELEVKLPSAEVKIETSDSSDDDEDENGEKKKKRFNIKMPKFGLPKAELDVNAPNIGVSGITADVPNIKPIEGSLEIEAPKFDATFPKMDLGYSDDESKKSKNTMGLAIGGAVPDIDANVTMNTGNMDFSLADKKKKGGSEFGIKFPKMKTNLKGNKGDHSESDTSSDEDAEGDNKAFGGKISIPSIDLSRPKADYQGSIQLPNAEFDVKQPKLDLETEIGDDENDDDDTKKKSSKFGFSIKMPKFNMKKKTLNADIEDKDLSAHLNLDSISGGTDDDRSLGEDKKKGKVSVKLPKFSMKKPDFDADLSVDKNMDVRADVKAPQVNFPEVSIHGDKEMPGFSLPDVSIEKPKLDLTLDSNIDVDGSKKFSIDSGKVNFGQLPAGITVGGQVQPPRVPDASLNLATGTSLQADVGFPGVELDVDHDDFDDEKKKSKFFKMPKFHMGKHHGEVKVDHGAKVNLPDAEFNLPTGKVELDHNISLDISSKDEGDSDDDKKDSGKKKSRFGIKMPKFQMKQSHPSGMNVDIKPEDVAFGVKIPALEANVESLTLEQDSISSDNTSIDMDLPKLPDLNPIEVDLTVPNVKVEVPEKDGKKKGKFSFKSNFKMPKLHMSSHGKGHAELEVPSTEITLPKVEIDSAAEIRKSDIDCGDIETEALNVKFGASLPKIDKPSTDFDIKFDSNVSYPNLSLDVKGDVKSDESDDEKNKGEKKKSVGLGFKMPKLSASPKTEFNLPDVKAEVNVKAPKTEALKLEGNFDLDEGDQYKKSPFIVKMPALNPVKPDLQLNVSAPKDDSHSDDSDSEEEKTKKGFKLGFKLPQLSMPQLSMGGKSEGLHADSTLNVKKPELDAPSIDTNVSLPEVNISTKQKGRFETDFNMPSFSADKKTSDDSSDSEDEKSKSKGLKLGFKMPKLSMGGKGNVDLDADAAIKVKQPGLDVPSIDAEMSLPEVDVKKKGSFGSHFKMPTFSTKADISASAEQVDRSGDSSDSDDEKSKKGLNLGFKMPKLSMGGKGDVDLDADASIKMKKPELDVPSIDADVSFPEVDVTTKKKGSFGSHFKMPTFSTKADISAAGGEQIDTSDDDSDSDDEKSKKGLKLGFKMPKLSMGGKGDANLDADAAIKLKQPEINVPSVDAEVSLPEVDITTKKKSSFGSHFKMPTFSTKANVSGAEQGNTSDDDSDSDDEKSKKGLKLGFKMPKLSTGGKSDVDLDADAAIKMKQPELDVPSVGADVSLPEVDITTKKKSSFGSHFKMPTFSTKANVSGVEQGDTSDDDSDSADDKSKKGLKLGFKMPKLSMGGKGDANFDTDAAIKVKQPELDVPSIDAEMSLPEVDVKKKGSFGSHFKMPTFSTKADVSASAEQVDRSGDSSDSDDEKSKKGLNIGFKMPKLSMGVKGDVDLDADASIKMNQPEINVPSVDAEVSLPEVDITTKKKGSFGSHFKMPTFSTKANVSGVELGDTSDDDSDSGDDKSKKGLKLGLKMPKLSMGGKGDVDLDADAAIKMKQPELDVPSIDADISLPEVDITTKKKGSFGSHFKMPTFSTKANVSGAEQVDTSDDDSDSADDKSKKGLKLGFKMPKLSMGGKSDVDLDADAAIKIKQPDLDVPSVGADISLPEVDITTKKKGSFGSHFKMPTFSSKADVSAGEQIDPSDEESDSDDEKSKKGLKLGFKMPQLSMSGKNDGSLDSDYTVKVKQPDLDIPSLDAEVSLPEAELSTKKKSSFGSHFKMPTFSTKANVSASGAEQVGTSDDSSDSEDEKSKKGLKLGFKMPQISTGGKGDVSLDSDSTFKVKQPALDVPSIDAEVSLPEAELSTKKKSSFGSHFKMPTFSTKANVNTIQVEKHDDSSDSEDEKSKKGLKIGVKMPQISTGIKGDVNLDSDSTIKIKQPELDVPSIDAVLLPEVDVTTKKKSSFGSHFKMPSFSTKANVSGAAKIETSDDSSDSDDENPKKGLKLGVKMPQLSTGVKGDINLDSDSTIKVKQPELDLPSIDAGVSLPDADLSIKKKSSFGSHFKMPSFSTKSNVTVSGVEVPEVNMVPPRLQTQEEEHGFSVTGEEDSEKKSHKIGIKLPKFQTRQRNAEVSLPQVELRTEHSSDEEDNDKELKVKVKKPKFGIKLPEFNKPKLDAGVNIQSSNLTGNIGSDVNFPRTSIEINQPAAISFKDTSNIDIQVGNIDAEVAKVNAQIAQVQAEIDIQSGKQKAKIEDDESSSSSSDSETEERTKTSGINFGLKLPKFSLGKDKPEVEPKVDVSMPTVSLTTKNNGDDMTSPSLSSLEVEPVKLEGGHGSEKEKKKFSLGLKMPKFPSKGSAVVVEGDVGSSSKDVDVAIAPKPLKVNVKAPKMKLKKKKGEHHQSSSSDSDSDENNDEDDQPRNKDASGNTQLMGVEVKLPRVQVYKNVEYQDAEKGHHDSSSDEEDEVKDIKKNIGARFGVKLKKPKMFSSSKIEITGKNDSGNNSSSLQPEWKLPRVDLRRASKSSDQELSIEVDLDGISEQQKLEQLSPSERAEAIRRDSKSSAGIRLHSPSYISLMPSPRSKKPNLEMLDVDSSPKLLSVTRLDPTPPIESSVKMQQPMYGNIELTTTMTGPQVSASQVPSSVIMASDAVKMKRGPPTPARRFIVPFEPNSAVLRVAPPVITTDVTVEGGFSTLISEDVSSEFEVNIVDPSFASGNNQQASDTDISITTSTGSDTLVISCPTPSSGQQEAHNRKASSLGDLTRIPTSGSEEGSLERTVSLDFKPVSTLAGNSSRAIYNLAVQDLSRVGEDSDEDYNLNRKRTLSDHASLESEVTIVTADEVDAQRLSSANMPGGNRTFLTINTDVEGGNVTQRPLGGDIAESLWFGSTSIQTVESVQTTMSYTQMEESISTDVTLTTTSLGTSPSETSSSSEGSPFSPASPEPSGESTPNLIEHSSQIENGRTQQFHTEMTELAQGELGFSDTHTITLEMSSLSDDSQPQPLTDLNPSAGNFAAVRNRFEQLSGSNPLNGGEMTGSLGRNSGRLSQTQGTVIKRLSGNFEDLPPSSVNVVQKSFMQHIAPELSEGALSRTVIISSLTLDRAEQNSVSSTTGIGPESPVPNLEPPC
ncbi:neuroblast differentiation-associated protein AHNAK-like isoform X5 [Daphnia pulicaria]|uniref:neuroblast differentiation-associated protein AHNAK-like isoform X5 n=1 Tax=Daphnia pulicaria TaxID=35523 RepID=UPI001EEBF5C5|nr:neuroblast differentiation-associated protein AHNAK-like isoform X5 [Daphnia pulicaria]